jgi:hypothetical protein
MGSGSGNKNQVASYGILPGTRNLTPWLVKYVLSPFFQKEAQNIAALERPKSANPVRTF